MSKKKMCPYWDISPRGKNYDVDKCRCGKCPKNTNAICEIIPKKPKMVRVKAWADVSKEGILFGAFPERFIFPSEKSGYRPCTVLIEAKWLKERK